jgi:cytochrome c oxidase subunit 3
MYNKPITYNHQKAHRFTMWLAIASISMAFAGFTSAFLVRKAAGQWVNFSMPASFFTSTILLVLSSVTIHAAHVANKKENKFLLISGLASTIVLGALFCFYQFTGWQELLNSGIYLDGNPSGSFFYVITGTHFAHLAGGIVFLLIAFIRTLWKFVYKSQNSTYMDNNEKSRLWIRTDLLSMYWHFMDVLWIYLFVFLSLNLNH